MKQEKSTEYSQVYRKSMIEWERWSDNSGERNCLATEHPFKCTVSELKDLRQEGWKPDCSAWRKRKIQSGRRELDHVAWARKGG